MPLPRCAPGAARARAGGHIILVEFDELGWEWPYHLVHELEQTVDGVPAVGGVLGWLLNTLASAIVGFVIGAVIALVVDRLPTRATKGDSARQHA